MDMSLYKILRVNRGKFSNKVLNNPYSSETREEAPPYKLSDFGENVINNHFSTDGAHSEKCQTIFNYITKDFRDRCTSHQTYNSTIIPSFLIPDLYLEKCALLNADLVFTPYLGAATTSVGDYGDFVLPVASHYDNNNSDGIPDNDDRHDITANSETLLENVVAVGARRDTLEGYQGSTSYGYGMEFFEDIEALDTDYPNKDLESAAAEVLVDSTGYIITSNVHLGFANYFSIGDEVILHYGSEYPTAHVTEVIDGNNLRIDTQFPEITQTGVYLFARVTLAGFCAQQAQSWAVPIVAGKLKVIKMTTGADWDTVRAAARATAKRNILGIPELDNTNWDIYRGFGRIDVQAAINYINNNN